MEFKIFVIILSIIKMSLQDFDAQIKVKDDKKLCRASYHQCSIKTDETICTTGPPGDKGERGYPGMNGIQGPPGYQGLTGLPGNCTNVNFRRPKHFLQKMPNNTVFINTSVDMSCIYYTEDRLQDKEVNYRDRTGSFWYSEQGFNLQEFYGLSMEELRYISDYSSAVTLKVRYYCKNSFNHRTEPDDYIRFLSWNNVVVSSEPSDFSPTSYVIDKIDGCKNNDIDSWSHTDIKITGSASLRLPIVDLQIRDASSDPQFFYLQPLEFCFSNGI